jgi:hypothetical protein
LKILRSGKSWSKICKNKILGNQGGERAQLLGGSARGALLLEAPRAVHESGGIQALDPARSCPCKQGAADLKGSALPADPWKLYGWYQQRKPYGEGKL